MKKIIALVMTTILCLMNFQGVFASEVNSSDSTTPLEKRTTYVSTTTVYIDGEALEVPVEMPLTQSYSLYSNDDIVSDVQRVYIPFTEEAKENNSSVVNSIKYARGSSGFSTKDGYIYFESTLNYKRDYYNNNYAYPRIDLISFKLDREIYTKAPFRGFKNATATAYQLGTRGSGGDLSVLDQKKTYSSFSYGTTQTVPSSWVPVLTVGTDYNRGVSYSIPLLYLDSSKDTTLTYFHEAK